MDLTPQCKSHPCSAPSPGRRRVRFPLAPQDATVFTGGVDDLTEDQMYAAIRARDTRFDGVFYTCVASTGIFCRPSCPSRTPARTGVRFVPSAAAAVEAGFRACKRCGPAAPPGSSAEDPAADLARRALHLIDRGALDAGPRHRGTVPELARRLAVSERTLHRSLVNATGAGPLAHARMRRARRAHELVLGSDLPLGTIAHAAGFGSERQFLDTFTRVYGHAPSVLRSRRGPTSTAELTASLAVRRPFDGAGLAAWFAARAVPGVESVEGTVWTRAVRLPHGPGVLHTDLGTAEGPLELELRLNDVRDYGVAIALARDLLDLDADPVGIDTALVRQLPALAGSVTARPGVRLPGTPSLREALLWAITGQQVTVVQTREQITRATDLAGEELPEALRRGSVRRPPVDPLEAAARAEEWFRGPRARREALRQAVPAAPDEALPLADLERELLALRGIGPWTVQYTLLRGARASDLVPRRDVALLAGARSLGLVGAGADHEDLVTALAPASPWRSYACLHLWHAASGLPGNSPHRRSLQENR